MRTFAQKPKAPQQATPAKSTIPSRARFGQSLEVSSMLRLQRTIGNQAMQRMLQTNAEELEVGLASTALPHVAHDFSQIPLHPKWPANVHAKLTVGPPGNIFEQQADRISERVMRMPEPQLQRACACGGGCPQCQREQLGQKYPRLRTQRVASSDLGQSEAPPIVHEVLASPGQPLDAATRAFMEDRFGHDFSRVRVHTDERAVASAHAVGAAAYTVGRNIVFDRGSYAPDTASGQRLLAHELAHVVQQAASPVGGPVVRRQISALDDAPEFRGCSPWERFRLDHQLARAQAMVAAAIAEVSRELARTDRSSGIITTAGSAISRYFKTDQTRHIRTLLTRLTTIQNRLARGPSNWECVSVAGCIAHCKRSYSAAACASPNRIFLCPTHFLADDLLGALTLVHEAAHQAGLGLRPGIDPFKTETYQSDPRFAGLTTSQALDNPDSLMSLVADLMYGPAFGDLGGTVWTPTDMTITGLIRQPDIGGRAVGRLPDAVGRLPKLERFGSRTVIEDQFQGEFIFNASFSADTPRRPALLRPPKISLRIVLTRTPSAGAAPRRIKQAVLFDRTEHAKPNLAGILEPSGGRGGYDFDLRFDTGDRGDLSITAEIRDPDTSTTLTYRDSLPVRPSATSAP